MKKKKIRKFKKMLRANKFKNLIKKEFFNGLYIHCCLFDIKATDLNIKRVVTTRYNNQCKSIEGLALQLSRIFLTKSQDLREVVNTTIHQNTLM